MIFVLADRCCAYIIHSKSFSRLNGVNAGRFISSIFGSFAHRSVCLLLVLGLCLGSGEAGKGLPNTGQGQVTYIGHSDVSILDPMEGKNTVKYNKNAAFTTTTTIATITTDTTNITTIITTTTTTTMCCWQSG